jgi:hypothetical protein
MFALDVRPLRQLMPDILAADAHVLTPPEPARLDGDGGPVPAAVYYWVGRAGPVQLTVHDGSGAVVVEVEQTATAGLNRWVWDLTSGAQAGGGQQGGGFARGRTVGVGVYTVRMRSGEASAEGIVQVSR